MWPDCIGDKACYGADTGGAISVACLNFLTKQTNVVRRPGRNVV